MLKVGITGGIGSGKSVVSKIFATLNVPVLDSDQAAKFLMENDVAVKSKLVEAFGEEIYKNGRLNRPFLSSIVFNNPQQLKILNDIVHPATIAYAKEWMEKQKGDYAIKEAALFFESGSHKDMDVMIGVSAPKELRLERAIKRDQTSEREVLNRMDKQMDEDEKMAKCDYIIYNDGTRSLIQQVLDIHTLLIDQNRK